MGTQRIKSGRKSKRVIPIIEKVRNWYKGWLESGEPVHLLIWVLLVVLLWIKLFHTV